MTKVRKIKSDRSILHDDYFRERPAAALLLSVRLVLLCAMSASAVAVFCRLYSYPGNIFEPVGIAVGASCLIYTLASLFPSMFVYGGIAAAAGAVIWLLRDRLYEQFTYFWDYMMLRLDSRLIDTSGFFAHGVFRIRSALPSDVEKMNTAFFWAAAALAILCAVIFTYSIRTRFRISIPIMTITYISIPAVAAEKACYLPEYIVFLVCMFACEAVSSSYDLDGGFIFGSRTASYQAERRNDADYGSKTRFFMLSKKTAADIARYHKYTQNMVAMAVTASIAFFGAAAVIPDGRGINYQRIFDAIDAIATSAVDAVGDLFGVTLGTADDKNYFSSDSYGNISGDIGIEPPGSRDRPVLEVTLTRNDIPVYLRGDIGVEFNGRSWTSVTTIADDYIDAVPADFYPEEEYQVFRRYMVYSYPEMPIDDMIPLQMVSVKYLRNTRVVFQPLAAYELNYKNSDYYDCFGDFILRTRTGFVSNYEGLALTPEPGIDAASAAAGVWDSIRRGDIAPPTGDYNDDLERYRDFIFAHYIGEDSGERDLVPVRDVFPSGMPDTINNNNEYKYYFSEALCRYFHENFTYSLEVDNGDEPLDSFLNDTHSGHCALFATAMTLSLREWLIPARYVTGYVVYPGTMQEKDGVYTATLTEKMLHAWVEVYFEGVGWLPFDPTAGVPGYAEIVYDEESEPDVTPEVTTETTTVTSVTTMTSPAEETTVTSETAAPEEETTLPPSDTEDDTGSSGSSSGGRNELAELIISLLPWIAAIALIGAAAAVLILFVRNLGKAEKRVFASFRTLPPTQASAAMYRFVLAVLAKKGIEPGNEQFYDFAERIDGSIELKGANVFMMDVMPVFEKCEFGNEDISPVTEDERAAVYRFTTVVYSKIMSGFAPVKRFFVKISLFL